MEYEQHHAHQEQDPGDLGRHGRHPVQPEEWFLVPLFVIDEAVARIKDGSITGYIYDPKAAKLVRA